MAELSDHTTLDRLVDAVAADGLSRFDALVAAVLGSDSDTEAVGGRDGLQDSVLDRYEHRMNEAVFEPFLAAATHDRAVPRLLDDVAKWVTSDGRQGCLLLNEATAATDIDEATALRLRRWRSHIRATFTEAMVRRTNDQHAAGERAEVLFASVLGLNTLVQAGVDADELFGTFLAVQAAMTDWI